MSNYKVIVYKQSKQGAKGESLLYDIENPISSKISLIYRGTPKDELSLILKKLLETTCRGEINAEYLDTELSKNTIIMILIDMSNDNRIISDRIAYKLNKNELRGDPFAFILGREDPEDSSSNYIDIVCSLNRPRMDLPPIPGKGPQTIGAKQIITFFQEYSKSLGKTSVGLRALAPVLTYYPTLGYQHTKDCKTIDIELPESIKRRDKRTYPTTTDLAYDDDDFSEFMIELRKKNYGRIKKGTEKVDRDCDEIPRNKLELKTADCGDEGYYMRKCF